MKKTVVLFMLILILVGCVPKSYNVEKQEIQEIRIKSKYIMSNSSLKTIVKSKFEKADTVYYVETEKELAKVLQYNIEKGIMKVAYQSNHKIDIDKTALIMSFFNPFDISLILSTTDYRNQKDELIYQSKEIEIKNMDDRYEDANNSAKRVVSQIISKEMSNNEKIEKIHDYLVTNVFYDEIAAQNHNDEQNSAFCAAGALIDKRAVCAGYSRAFMLMARYADIPALYISSDVINHGWNLVYGDTGWRYIDVTWDDSIQEQFGTIKKQFLDMDIAHFLNEGSHLFDDDKSNEFYLDLAETFF